MLKIYLTKGIVRFKKEYLLLKKAKDIFPENIGKWECPGGKIDPDEDPQKAILRETKEETGINCNLIKELPFLQMKDEKCDSQCYIYLLEAPSDKVRLSAEHSEYRWVKPEEVKNMHLVLFASLLLEYFNNPKRFLE